MVEHELISSDADINDEGPFFFHRLGEIAFGVEEGGPAPVKAAEKRQRECIATAPQYGVAAIAGESGKHDIPRARKMI